MKFINLRMIILFVSNLSISLTLLCEEVKESAQIKSGAEYGDIHDKTAPLIETDTNAAVIIFEEAIYYTGNSFSKAALMRQREVIHGQKAI